MLKLGSYHWQKLYKLNARDWQREDLEQCSADELIGLCRLLGIAYSGTKAQNIERIERSLIVRLELATWPDCGNDYLLLNAAVAELEKTYKRARLVELARLAGSIHYLNKHGIIKGLFAWRADCRRSGQEFDAIYRAQLKAAREQASKRPQQLRLV